MVSSSSSCVNQATLSGRRENDNDDEDDESSKQLSQPTKPTNTRRMLAPFKRSATLKSGCSLQDLKSSPAGTSMNVSGATPTAPPTSGGAAKSAWGSRAKLQRQRSSQQQASNTRNPFRPSRSLLLLAQNQHIPQASAQLDCLVSRQQADYLQYAQYAAAAAAAAASNRNNSNNNSNNCNHPTTWDAGQSPTSQAVNFALDQQPISILSPAQHHHHHHNSSSNSTKHQHHPQITSQNSIMLESSGSNALSKWARAHSDICAYVITR